MTLELLDEIDNRGGSANRMDFIRICGSEAAVVRWIDKFLVKKGKLQEITDNEGTRRYIKTKDGEQLQQTLRNHVAVSFIVEHLSGSRLRF